MEYFRNPFAGICWLSLSLSLLLPSSVPPRQNSAPAQHSGGGAVRVQMPNVLYHFQDNVAIHIRQLGGELAPTGSAQIPVFDDKNSFTLRIDAAEIAITSQSMANVLNNMSLRARMPRFKMFP